MVEISLKTWQHALKFKVTKDTHNLGEYKGNCELVDSTLYDHYDKAIITLTNCLSWNLDEDPPEEPEDFFHLLLHEEERQQPEVQYWLKYLAFVTKCDEQDRLAVDMIEDIKMYFSVKDPNGKLCLRLVYLFQPAEDCGFALVDRLVVNY